MSKCAEWSHNPFATLEMQEVRMTVFITLPGIGGSGEKHWQTAWERGDYRFRRFKPTSWDQPELDDWISALESEISEDRGSIVLIAHSLACLLVVHWAARTAKSVAGAVLVAVPDPQGANFPSAAKSFAPVPDARLPFPAIILASEDDPYGSIEYATERSKTWGAPLIKLGALGHINSASNLGAWSQGRALIDAFCAGLHHHR
jgi:uncharacterized protein